MKESELILHSKIRCQSGDHEMKTQASMCNRELKNNINQTNLKEIRLNNIW